MSSDAKVDGTLYLLESLPVKVRQQIKPVYDLQREIMSHTNAHVYDIIMGNVPEEKTSLRARRRLLDLRNAIAAERLR